MRMSAWIQTWSDVSLLVHLINGGSLQLASMPELRTYKAKYVVSSTGYDMLKPLSTILSSDDNEKRQ